MSRGRRHRYHRKYCGKMEDSSVREKVRVTTNLKSSSLIFILQTCEVQTLLNETKMEVCRKQQKARSE